MARQCKSTSRRVPVVAAEEIRPEVLERAVFDTGPDVSTSRTTNRSLWMVDNVDDSISRA